MLIRCSQVASPNKNQMVPSNVFAPASGKGSANCYAYRKQNALPGRAPPGRASGLSGAPSIVPEVGEGYVRAPLPSRTP